MPSKRALLIGINAYPHVPALNGCVNDVRLMRSVLVESFGFAEDRITLLADAQATREGILSAFDALVSSVEPDDIVVVHYAGLVTLAICHLRAVAGEMNDDDVVGGG